MGKDELKAEIAHHPDAIRRNRLRAWLHRLAGRAALSKGARIWLSSPTFRRLALLGRIKSMRLRIAAQHGVKQAAIVAFACFWPWAASGS